jgi:hypothetical protein
MNKPHQLTVNLHAPCACGSTEMSVTGPVLSMLMCACLDCQRSTGCGHADVAVVPAASLSTSGDVKSFARPSESGAQFTRHFCPQCGSPLYGQSSRAPDLRMFLVGFFAGQNDWFAPNQLIFARSLQSWDLISDHLPKHQTSRAGSAP